MQRPKKFRKKKYVINKEVSKNLPIAPPLEKKGPPVVINKDLLHNKTAPGLVAKKGQSRKINLRSLPSGNNKSLKSHVKNKQNILKQIKLLLINKFFLFHKSISNVFIPHIYRIINARIFKLGLLCLLTTLLVVITVVNIFYTDTGFNQYKIGALLHYSDPNVHVKMARVFFENNDFERAQQELFIARTLSPQNQNIENQIHLVSLLLTKPREIESDLKKWEKITIEKPNYRDGFFKLAVLYYQIFNKDRAKKYVEKTLELDPNFQPAIQFLELLSR